MASSSTTPLVPSPTLSSTSIAATSITASKTSSSSSSTPLSTSSTSLSTSSSSSSIVVITSTSSSSSSTLSSSSSTPLSTSTTPLSTSTSISSSSSTTNVLTTSTPLSSTSITPKTSTIIVFPSSTVSVTPTAVSRTSTGFFSHTGEVAGVFTAVGIVALVIIALIATTCIRRRRAARFDKDVAEAAMEAAATSRTNAWDDDGAYNPPGGYGAGAGGYGAGAASNYGGAGGYGGASAENAPYAAGYSSESHGTYGQPPMEAYAMHNVGPSAGHGYEVGQVVDSALLGGAAGAAGIGAMRARSMNRGGQDGGYEGQERTPYPAFAGPPAGVGGQPQPDPYGANLRYRRSSGAEPELLAAAGLGGAAGMGAAAGMNRRGSERTTATHTSNPRSLGSFEPVQEDSPANQTSSSGHSPPANDESYASHYQPGYAAGAPDPFKRNALPQPAERSPALQNPYGDSDGEEEDPYAYEGGYADEHHAEARGSLDDDGFYGATPRVLKVANE